MIYLLLVIIALLFIVSIAFDKDLFSPAVIMCGSYLLATSCAILNIDKWDVNLSYMTFGMILLGILSFIVPSLLINRFNGKRRIFSKRKNLGAYQLNRQVQLILVFLQVITVMLNYYYIKKTVGIGSILSFSETMGEYRDGTAYGDMESLVPTYVNQMIKVSQIVAYICLYDLLSFLISNKANRKKSAIAIDVISIMIYTIQSLLSGGRYKLICYIIGSIIMASVMLWRKNRKPINIKYASRIIIALIMTLFLFSSTRTLVGRSNTDDAVSYVSSYFGGSIQLLDLYNRRPLKKSAIFGQESFYAINNTLSKVGIVPEYRSHLEFRSSNGVLIGNVYTAFRCFYRDFGYSGIVILQALLAVIWTFWYKSIRKNDNNNEGFDSSLLFYAMFVNCLFLSSYRDNFYCSAISVATMTLVVYFAIIHKVLITRAK